MTDEQMAYLEAVAARAASNSDATVGWWKHDGLQSIQPGEVSDDDAAFIAAATPDRVCFMVREIDQLRAARDAMRPVVEAAQRMVEVYVGGPHFQVRERLVAALAVAKREG